MGPGVSCDWTFHRRAVTCSNMSWEILRQECIVRGVALSPHSHFASDDHIHGHCLPPWHPQRAYGRGPILRGLAAGLGTCRTSTPFHSWCVLFGGATLATGSDNEPWKYGYIFSRAHLRDWSTYMLMAERRDTGCHRCWRRWAQQERLAYGKRALVMASCSKPDVP